MLSEVNPWNKLQFKLRLLMRNNNLRLIITFLSSLYTDVKSIRETCLRISASTIYETVYYFAWKALCRSA